MFTIVGLIYLTMGERATILMGTRQKPTTAAYVISIAGLLLGIGIYVWLRSTLQDHGYDFQGRF